MNRVTLDIIGGPDYNRDAEGWEHNAYTLKLRYDGRQMTVPWKQGIGITDDPDPRSVLECLFSDATSVDNARSFEDWADDYGYDTDSRKAEETYNAVERQTRKLKRLLGVSEHESGPWFDTDTEELAQEYAHV